MAMNKLRSELAETFLAALNEGRLPWRPCWQNTYPVNAVTGQRYRGVNAAWLTYRAEESGFRDSRWCTFTQAQAKGWKIKKGVTGSRIEYWAYYDLQQKKLLSWAAAHLLAKDREYAEKYLQLRSRIYTVFNAEQIDGIPEREYTPCANIDAIRSKRDALLQNMGLGYREEGMEAYYSPISDTVTLPPEHTFLDTYSYTCTFLHECGHATGHPSRLNRDLSVILGSESYAREELRAEIASAFTAQALDLHLTDEQLQSHTDLHKAYIQSWATVLKNEPEELFRAIKDAEKISDYLIVKGEFLQLHKERTELTQEIESPRELLKLAERYPDLNREQLAEVATGVREGLSQEQLDLLAMAKYSDLQMGCLRYCIQSGLSASQLATIANPAFSTIQMDILRSAYQAGLLVSQVQKLADPSSSPQEMLEIYQRLQADSQMEMVQEP